MIITVAGLVSPAAATAAGRSPSGDWTTRWDGRLASAMHADAAAGSIPSLIRRAAMPGRWRMPMRMTRFVPERLSADQSIRLAGSLFVFQGALAGRACRVDDLGVGP